MGIKKTRKIISLMALSATLLLVGCGGDNGGSDGGSDDEDAPKPMTTSSFGVITNSSASSTSSAPSRVLSVNKASTIDISNRIYVVKGLNVRCTDSSGDEVTAIYSVTDENGTFSHREGDDCTFGIGDFYPRYSNIGGLIGGTHIEKGGIVTPQGITSQAYTNTLRMLYSLDNDQNRSNGIDISENEANSFPLTTNDFDYQWDNWDSKWRPMGDIVLPYFAPVSETEVLGTIDNPITGVLADTRFILNGAGSFQFHNNGALTHITSAEDGSDIVGGVWSVSNGVITVRFIDNTESFHLVPSSLPLTLGTVIHHQELNEDATVVEIETF